LQSIEKYAGTLLHEVAHAISGAKDVTRDFEDEHNKTFRHHCIKSIKKIINYFPRTETVF